MYKAKNTRLSDWFSTAWANRESAYPLVQEVKPWCDKTIKADELINTTLTLFLELVQLVKEKEILEDWVPIAEMPLSSSQTMQLWDDKTPLDKQLAKDKSPKLVLKHRLDLTTNMIRFEPGEDYRRELYPKMLGPCVTQTPIPQDPRHFNCLYVCSRTQDAIDQGSQFERALLVRYYPDSLT